MSTLNPETVSPTDLKPGDRLGYKVVAVIGEVHDWAAYAGLTTWTDDEVARSGDKLSAQAAEKLFLAPVWAGLSYRS